jgi:hypothetical protein
LDRRKIDLKSQPTTDRRSKSQAQRRKFAPSCMVKGKISAKTFERMESRKQAQEAPARTRAQETLADTELLAQEYTFSATG